MRKNISTISKPLEESLPVDAAPGDLFREAMKGAQPIRRIERAALHTPKIPPIPVQQLIDEQAVMLELAECEIDEEIALETGEEASFVRDGVPRQVLRKLRGGHWVLQGELDLHGATREEARVLVANYLRYCLDTRRRCVRIIHGKGLGSKNRVPILKSRVKQWLMLHDEVIAFCQAPAIDGGGGALMVLLRG